MARRPGRYSQQQQVVDEDDTGGLPLLLVRPHDDVYSFFMFIGPTDWKKRQVLPEGDPRKQRFKWDIVMAYILVAMNLLMQSVLLMLIFEEVVLQNIDWQNGILKLGGQGDHVMKLVTDAPTGCNDGGSLCFHDSEGYSCAPPSIQLTGRWAELDTDGDGVWTRKEAIDAREALKCKYFVDPVEVFDVLLAMIGEREAFIWLHPEIKKGNGIHLPYFTYVMSDLIMCGYRSAEMCSNLIERGFFDAPMKFGTAPRVGTSVKSALRYCNQLLETGGMCERLLPSTYTVWKIESEAECGSPVYSQSVFTHPTSNATKALLTVGYSAPAEYELAQEFMFMIFKGVLVFTWLLAMMCDFKEIVKILTFCGRMPRSDEFGEDAVLREQDPSDPEDVRYRIQGITTQLRWTLVVLCAVRFVVTCVLMVVGVSYLIKTNGYADLIMNGVALAFIAEVSSVLYMQLLREEIRDQTGDIKPIKVEMYGIEWLNRRPAIIDMLCVVGILITVCLIMKWQLDKVVIPVHGALDCACLSKGDMCVEAQKYNYEFWHEYWLKGVPDVFAEVARLKASLPSAAASYLAVGAGGNLRPIGSPEERLEEVDRDAEVELSRLEKLERKEKRRPAGGQAPLRIQGKL